MIMIDPDVMADVIEYQKSRIALMQAALEPFAALLNTHSNGYERSADDEVVRSVGTLGRDYAFITVADLRRARAALARKEQVT